MSKAHAQTVKLHSFSSFLTGMAKVLDLGARLRKEPQSDFKALQSDWRTVGKDLTYSLREYGQIQKK